MKIEDLHLVKRIFEAALMAAEKPLMRRDLVALFDELEKPEDELIDQALTELAEDCEERGYELKRVASGYRYQVRQDLSRWVSKLWQERAPRYSRALLETLALIAYRQPITRGEIEEIRGVAVSSNIIKTLLEREWIKAVGHRDVPGRPAIYATTKQLLDYFDLKSLDQLPPLAEVRDLSTIGKELNIDLPLEEIAPANDDAAEGEQEAGSGEEPLAEGGEEPSAQAGEEPSAQAGEEPSAQAGEEPSAQVGEEPSVQEDEEPSAEMTEAAPGEPAAGEGGASEENAGGTGEDIDKPLAQGAEIAAFESWVDEELEAEESRQNDDALEPGFEEEMEQEAEIELQAAAKDEGSSLPTAEGSGPLKV